MVYPQFPQVAGRALGYLDSKAVRHLGANNQEQQLR
jgi:hypothetical protein